MQTTALQNVTNLVKIIKILKYRDHIWNHREKYIELSTNIPVHCSSIHEIAVTQFLLSKPSSKTNARVLSAKMVIFITISIQMYD